MTNYQDLFKTPELQNWFKCTLALHITRAGIVDFAEKEMNLFHHYILSTLPSGSICNSCTTPNVVLCPAKWVCKKGPAGKCSFHSVPPTGCPKRICDRIANEIVLVHKYGGPSWKNTDASKWCTSPWELSKSFFPPDGYLMVSTAEDTDFNGFISLIQNCTRLHSQLSPNADKVIEKVTSHCTISTLFDEPFSWREFSIYMFYKPRIISGHLFSINVSMPVCHLLFQIV